MKKTIILNNEEILQKTRRIAYQVLEDNYEEKELIIIGIQPNGYKYASQLKSEIEAINSVKVSLIELTLNKNQPLESAIELNTGKLKLDGKVILLVDDVANTGKTMYYAIKPLLEFLPKKVQAAVLVDRQHKIFPVTPDFVGLSLSTTLQEHIHVEFDSNNKAIAYLV